MSVFRIITTAEELLDAVKDKSARYLIIRNDLNDLPSIKLLSFQSIVGEFDGKKLSFAHGENGICLSKGNELKNLNIIADPDRKAIYQDSAIENMGTHHLTHLNIIGSVAIIIDHTTRSGKIDAAFIHIETASTADIIDRPNRSGKDIALGAFTIWNKNDVDQTSIELDFTHFSCGSEKNPVNGSGLMLYGRISNEGAIKANVISCGHIYLKGSTEKDNTAPIYTGECIGDSVIVKNFTNYGKITTYESNEACIYNCGSVDKWSITDRLETHGFSSAAFINAGKIGKLMLTHAIETFGIGAKGFYMFDGVIKDISFNSIITHGDASSAYDSSCFVERISVSQGITTFGSVRKVRVGEKWLDITANGVYLRKGATIKELKISGDISTHGISAKAIYNEGAIEKLLVGGMVFSDGDKGIAMEIKDGFLGGENIKFVSNHSEALILFNAKINGCKNLIAKGKEYDILSNENTTVNRVRIKDAEIENVFQKGVRINFILDEPDNADESPDKEINIQISDDKNADKTVTEENKKSTIIKMEDITPKLTEGHGGGPMTCKAPDDIKPKDKP